MFMQDILTKKATIRQFCTETHFKMMFQTINGIHFRRQESLTADESQLSRRIRHLVMPRDHLQPALIMRLFYEDRYLFRFPLLSNPFKSPLTKDQCKYK